jgi:hypothetical protein
LAKSGWGGGPVDCLLLKGSDAGTGICSEQRRDPLEIMEDRHGRASTTVTSQLPVEHWHEIISDPTLADAIS